MPLYRPKTLHIAPRPLIALMGVTRHSYRATFPRGPGGVGEIRYPHST